MGWIDFENKSFTGEICGKYEIYGDEEKIVLYDKEDGSKYELSVVSRDEEGLVAKNESGEFVRVERSLWENFLFVEVKVLIIENGYICWIRSLSTIGRGTRVVFNGDAVTVEMPVAGHEELVCRYCARDGKWKECGGRLVCDWGSLEVSVGPNNIGRFFEFVNSIG